MSDSLQPHELHSTPGPRLRGFLRCMGDTGSAPLDRRLGTDVGLAVVPPAVPVGAELGVVVAELHPQQGVAGHVLVLLVLPPAVPRGIVDGGVHHTVGHQLPEALDLGGGDAVAGVNIFKNRCYRIMNKVKKLQDLGWPLDHLGAVEEAWPPV